MQHFLVVVLFAMIFVAGCGSDVDQAKQRTTQHAGAIPEPAAHPSAGAITPAAETAAESIDGSLILDTVREISGDAYEGRGPASNGDRMTRDYLAKALAGLGFAPGAADGGWEQPFELVGINARQPSQWSFSGAGGELALQQGTDFIVASGVQQPKAVVSDAELVFVGYGIRAPEYDWDDFKDADLTGKVLIILNNDPDWDPALFAGVRRLYYGRWDYKYESAARRGAAAAIIIHTTPSAGYPWQVVQTSWTGEQFELPAVAGEPRLQMAAWVTEQAAEQLMKLAGQDLAALVATAKQRDFRPVSLGLTTSITLENRLSQVASANVLGLLRGSDPVLANEVIVYTAHHDHLGVAPLSEDNKDQDRIYNGARDNASGVGMVLSIARAFSKLPAPPRRSILIAFVGAEEQGLLGSEYFAKQPTFAPGRIAANINFDSGNIWGHTRDITFIGKGKSTLDQVAATVAAYQNRVVKGDQFPDKGYFYRSDQFNLARIGVPALYLEGGTDFIDRPEGWGKEQEDIYTAEHYHQPSDELSDDWNLDGMVDDSRFGFFAGWIIANRARMPEWNPGDEFEAARKAALTR